MYDDQVQRRPLPARLLADLEIHNPEPAYLESDGPCEAERVPVEHRPMGVREAERVVHLSLPRGGWLCLRDGENRMGAFAAADINDMTCPVCFDLHESEARRD